MNESIRQRLRAALRRGDPADEPGLTTEEVQGMRRTVLSAVEEPGRRRFLVPVLATAAAAVVLTLTVALALWRSHPRQIAPPERIVTVDKPLPTPSPPIPPSPSVPPVHRAPEAPVEPPKPPDPAPPSEPVRPRGSERPRQKRPAPRAEEVRLASAPNVPSVAEAPEEEPQPRQIQFSTPGGTRVLWTLASEPIL